MYLDIETEESTKCVICNKPLDGGDSPWSICFDPEWKHNCWGGDTHQYRALLCQDCTDKLLNPALRDINLDIKQVLVECRECVSQVNHRAEARHDDVDGGYYMDGAQYKIMEETKTLLDRIDSLTEGVK